VSAGPFLTISLWQPWASLVVLGAKHYETRIWKYPQDYRGRRVGIHAAKDSRYLSLIRTEPFASALANAPWQTPCPLGAILGSAVLGQAQVAVAANVPLIERQFGDFGPGRWAWEMLEPKIFDVPIPYKGRQGFFYSDLEAAQKQSLFDGQ